MQGAAGPLRRDGPVWVGAAVQGWAKEAATLAGHQFFVLCTCTYTYISTLHRSMHKLARAACWIRGKEEKISYL
jgi:hypothetical protein